jgi:hypothetical protein
VVAGLLSITFGNAGRDDMDERSRARRSAEAILADWREAERQRDDHEADSSDWVDADRRVAELRQEFHESVGELDSAPASRPVMEDVPA